MPVERMKPIHVFVPFETIERRAEDDALIVEGYAFCNEVVGGEGGIRLKRSAMEAATADYMRNGGGVVREMHQPIAAGIAHEAIWDARGCRLRAEIVDPVAKLKVERKVYRGFSVGVNPKVMTPAKEIEVAEWPETSLVDRPKDPDALLIYQSATFDPDAEVEVEVLEPLSRAESAGTAGLPDSPSLPPSQPGSSEAPAAVPIQPPDLVPPPEARETPSSASVAALAGQVSADGGGTPSLEAGVRRQASGVSGDGEEEAPQVTVGDARAQAAEMLRAAGWSEERIAAAQIVEAGAEAAPEPEWVSTASDSVGFVEVESIDRAISTATPNFPVRENLDAKPKSLVPQPQPPAKPQPAAPPGPPSKGPTQRAGVRREASGVSPDEGADDLVSPSLLTPDVSRLTPAVERVIKHEGEKWVVYSEGGKKLGEHDTREEAVKQLQAIEIEKHKDEPGATQPKKRAAELLARWSISSIPHGWVVCDHEADRVWRFDREEDARAHVDAQIAADVERAAPSVDDTISNLTQTVSILDTDLTAAISRAEFAETELARVQRAHEEVLTRLAAAEAQVARLQNAPAPPPVVRFPHALSKEYLVTLGQGHDTETERLRAEYPEAKRAAEAERETSRGMGGPAYDRWMTIRSSLAQRGVLVD